MSEVVIGDREQPAAGSGDERVLVPSIVGGVRRVPTYTPAAVL